MKSQIPKNNRLFILELKDVSSVPYSLKYVKISWEMLTKEKTSVELQGEDIWHKYFRI